ncbi:MAG: DUF373 family protein [Candidatus Bathyarchaeia archaeon]
MSMARQEPEKILILCVDRDNDVGKKADVKTPIIGRDKSMEAATRLILRDPEEADANAMFEAIRIYDSLEASKSGEEYEVATIAGLTVGGIAADRKLVSELASVLERFKANSIILVTDGFSDEDILPLIQSRVPVTSVRRVIVKHSESIEETAAVLSKYLRMLVEDPRYSRVALGLPGILLLVLGVLLIINVSYPQIFNPYGLSTYAWIISLLIVGASLLIRGYRLDEKFLRFCRWVSQIYLYTLPRLITGFSLVAGLLLIGIGFFQAGSHVAVNVIPSPPPVELSAWFEFLPGILGSFISKSLTLLIMGICITLGGRLLRHIFDRDPRFWRTLAFTVVCIWSWEIFNEASLILINPTLPSDRLIIAIVVGIIVTIASGLGTHALSKKYEKFFEGRKAFKG